MTGGFRLDFGEYGYLSPARLGLALRSRTITEPSKDDHTERVPYSNVTYDFDAIFGMESYGERTLTYVYDFLHMRDNRKLQYMRIALTKMMHFSGMRNLYDESFPDFHFSVRAPVIDFAEENGVCTVTLIFHAAPELLPNAVPVTHTAAYPDINGDGKITASDATMILQAYNRILVGEPTGLTPAQEQLADANLDGKITPDDAVLVLRFATQCVMGRVDSPASWQAFLSEEGVL